MPTRLRFRILKKAISAAREGLDVLLIERSGCLGGALSGALVYPFMRHWCRQPDGSMRILNAGIFGEMCRRHREAGGASERGWQSEIFKFVLDDMVTEAGIAAAVAHQTNTNAHTLDVSIVQEKLVAKGAAIH